MSAWEQQAGENNLWYGRFERFRLMEPTRSLLRLYNDEQATKAREKAQPPPARKDHAPASWNKQYKLGAWKDRAEAWDAHQRQQRLLEIEQEQTEQLKRSHELRAKTITALQALLGRVLSHEQQEASRSGAPHMDVKTLKNLAQAAALIFKELRLEFGEATEITDIQSKGERINPVMDMAHFFQQIGQREKDDR